MKNLPLKLMYLLVITLLVYSCTKDQFTAEKAVQNKFQLVSPDKYVLAKSDAELFDKVKKQLTADFGAEYIFTIQKVNYAVHDKVTHAEVIYHNSVGGERNLIFYWLHDGVTTHGLTADPLTVPSCAGDCGPDWAPSPCKSVYNINTQQYRCQCTVGNIFASDDCMMTVPGGPGTFSCQGQTCANNNLVYACQVAFNPSTGDVECICTNAGTAGCGAVVIELDNDLGVLNQ